MTPETSSSEYPLPLRLYIQGHLRRHAGKKVGFKMAEKFVTLIDDLRCRKVPMHPL